MTNVIKLDQETLTKVFDRLIQITGTMGSTFFLENVIQEFAVYNNETISSILHFEFDLIEPEEIIEFVETAGTIYFQLEE